MALQRTYPTDLLVYEKFKTGEWIAEPSTGRIYSTVTMDYVRPFMTNRGYLQVHVGPTTAPLSRAIWIAAHGIPELSYLQIDHINEIKTDNRLENLRLITPAGNSCHSNAKVNSAQVRDIRSLYAQGGITHRELGEMYGIARRTVTDLINEETFAVRTKPKATDFLTDALTQQIYEDCCCRGEKFLPVAEKYGVSLQTVISAIEAGSLNVRISKEVNN